MATPTPGTSRRSDWDAPPATPRARAVAVVVAVWASAAGAGGLVAAALGLPFVAGAAVVVAALAADLATIGRRTVRRLGAADAGSERLVNIAEGLAGDLGLSIRVLTFPGDAPQALVCRAGGPLVAVSSGAVAGLTRTELEAVVAHCLVRLDSGAAGSATLAAHLGLLARAAGTVVGPHEDVAAVAVTRYPPALIAALAKCAPATGRSAPLHFVADHPCHVPSQARAVALADL